MSRTVKILQHFWNQNIPRSPVQAGSGAEIASNIGGYIAASSLKPGWRVSMQGPLNPASSSFCTKRRLRKSNMNREEIGAKGTYEHMEPGTTFGAVALGLLAVAGSTAFSRAMKRYSSLRGFVENGHTRAERRESNWRPLRATKEPGSVQQPTLPLQPQI
jgi:hypothetical protein